MTRTTRRITDSMAAGVTLAVALWMLGAAPAPARTILNEAPCDADGVQTKDPQDIVVDALGDRHYVADSGNGRVYVKAFGGTCSHTIRGTQSGELTLQDPWGVTLDEAERIYVSDRQSNSIWKYQAIAGFPTGSAPDLVDAFADLGLDEPHGLGADGDRIYIADTGNRRVVMITSSGAPIGVLGQPDDGDGDIAGELLEPTDVAVCAADSESDHAGMTYVVDRARANVQVFRADGSFAFWFAGKGSRLGQLKSPNGIGVDGQCNVYVADTGNERSQMYDAAGNFLEVVKGPSDDPVTGIASNAVVGSPYSGGVFVTSPAGDSVIRYEWIDYDQTGDGDIDSDRDGLPELWEVEGVDTDGDGTIEYELPAADPLRKDVFVEADFTGGLGTIPVVGVPGAEDHLDLVVDAFSKAPVANPDGTTGIDLVIERSDQVAHDGEGIVFASDLEDPDVKFLFSSIKRNNFGSAEERERPNAPDVLAAKSLVYRYMIFARSICEKATLDPAPACTKLAPLGGWADFRGDDFIVAVKNTAPDRQAALFMHELGHTLGLRHGGGDDDNCKPNYLSVMNYAFKGGIPNPSAPLDVRIDYSRVALRTLDENKLSEAAGIGAAPMGRLGARTDFTLWSADGLSVLPERADKPIDWDADGQIEGIIPPMNVNAFPIEECEAGEGGPKLKGHDDWSHLVYAVRTPHSFPQPRRPTVLTDMTLGG